MDKQTKIEIMKLDGCKVLDDWGKVQLNGKVYYIMYVL